MEPIFSKEGEIFYHHHVCVGVSPCIVAMTWAPFTKRDMETIARRIFLLLSQNVIWRFCSNVGWFLEPGNIHTHLPIDSQKHSKEFSVWLCYDHGSQKHIKSSKNWPENHWFFAGSFITAIGSLRLFERTKTECSLILNFLQRTTQHWFFARVRPC
jgi:hypothetical protein